jgi:Leucine-rich repeat (LRR) protein
MRNLLAHPRRWLRFSVRAVLLFFLVMGVWLAVERRNAIRQEQVVRHVARLGGSVDYAHWYDGNGNRIAQPEEPGPRWLQGIIGEHYLLQLTGVYITNVTNEDLRFIAGCPTIKRFGSSDTDDEGAEILSRLNDLESIDIKSTRLTDEGIRHLGQLRKLQTLSIDNARVTDTGLTHLANLRALKQLSVSDTQVTSAGVARLKEHLSNLQVYNAGELPSVEDEKQLIAHVIETGGRFRADATGRITRVEFTGSSATDADLLPVAGFTNLKEVQVGASRITPVGVIKLRQRRPDVQVVPALDTTRPEEIDAVTALCEQGAKVRINPSGFVEFIELYHELTEQQITDDALTPVLKLKKLTNFTSTSPLITDEGVRSLSNLETLESIALWEANITDEGVTALARLSKLKSIVLRGKGITDKSLAKFAGLAGLQKLSLRNTGVTGSGLQSLAGISVLIDLDLHGCPLNDDGLMPLATLKHLQKLNLGCTDITDAGLAHVAKLPMLERLFANATRVSDAGLVHLHASSCLRYLNVADTAVTQRGAAELSKTLTRCRVKQ